MSTLSSSFGSPEDSYQEVKVMSKHIKFRVWDKDCKEMHVCGENVHDSMGFDEDGTAYYYNLQNGEGSGDHGSYILMQYIGRKDRDKCDIYDGDIVENSFSKRDGFCYKVIWDEEEGQWLFDPFMKGDETAPLLGIEEFLQGWEAVGLDDNTLEVIGNVYEHPHLLQKGDE